MSVLEYAGKLEASPREASLLMSVLLQQRQTIRTVILQRQSRLILPASNHDYQIVQIRARPALIITLGGHGLQRGRLPCWLTHSPRSWNVREPEGKRALSTRRQPAPMHLLNRGVSLGLAQSAAGRTVNLTIENHRSHSSYAGIGRVSLKENR